MECKKLLANFVPFNSFYQCFSTGSLALHCKSNKWPFKLIKLTFFNCKSTKNIENRSEKFRRRMKKIAVKETHDWLRFLPLYLSLSLSLSFFCNSRGKYPRDVKVLSRRATRVSLSLINRSPPGSGEHGSSWWRGNFIFMIASRRGLSCCFIFIYHQRPDGYSSLAFSYIFFFFFSPPCAEKVSTRKRDKLPGAGVD